MAKTTHRQRWSPTEVLNVDPVNAELRNLVGEMNGRLDGENLLQLLTADKFALRTFNEISVVGGTGFQALGISSSQTWNPIVSTTIQADDGRLQVEGIARSTMGNDDRWWSLGILVDGALVARTPPSDTCVVSTLRVVGCPPVGAGLRTVELVFQAEPGGSLLGGRNPFIDNHLLWVRTVRR